MSLALERLGHLPCADVAPLPCYCMLSTAQLARRGQTNPTQHIKNRRGHRRGQKRGSRITARKGGREVYLQSRLLKRTIRTPPFIWRPGCFPYHFRKNGQSKNQSIRPKSGGSVVGRPLSRREKAKPLFEGHYPVPSLYPKRSSQALRPGPPPKPLSN